MRWMSIGSGWLVGWHSTACKKMCCLYPRGTVHRTPGLRITYLTFGVYLCTPCMEKKFTLQRDAWTRLTEVQCNADHNLCRPVLSKCNNDLRWALKDMIMNLHLLPKLFRLGARKTMLLTNGFRYSKKPRNSIVHHNARGGTSGWPKNNGNLRDSRAQTTGISSEKFIKSHRAKDGCVTLGGWKRGQQNADFIGIKRMSWPDSAH